MWNKLISYAADFSSFLLYKLDSNAVKQINKILLFGSVARGTADEKSDVDIFIDVISGSKILNAKIDKIVNDFYESAKFRKYWNLLGVKNEIKCVVGQLDKWEEMKQSVVSDGILFYGKFVDVPKNGESMVLLSWENIHPDTKRVLLNKRIFGYKHHNKFYQGLLQKYNGERLGKGVVLVPLEYKKIFLDVFRQMKIKVEIREVFMTTDTKKFYSEIKERLGDFHLSEDEKKDAAEALELHKKGKLLSKKDVFG